jgi:ATP-dependent exoDNAse (exonuclease V) beta subunit
LATDGYAATLYGWVQRLAPACNVRDLSRLVQLVELAYSYQPDRDNPRLRTDEFVTLVEGRRVESPTSARVRVMTVHQAKGLQFDIVVLPELDVRLGGQPPPIIAGRPSPGEPWDCVCRYVPSEIQPLLPRRLADLCGQQTARVIEESLCVLYVALTRAVHALHLIIAPARESEKNLPATLSGVLRGALAPDAKPQPLAILYEHGDAEWGRGITHGAPSVGLTVVDEPLTVRLAPSRKQHRGWEHRSPSQLEGGPKIDLARHLRLDQSGAMARGTLMHAWFQQIGWLDDGPPDEAVLREIAGRPEFRGLDSMALLADFRRTLTAPAVAQALCKANYQQPDMTAPQLRLLRERPFALRDGDAILSGTFDRLVVRYEGAEPRAADVLDFKSDSIRDDDPTAIQVRTEFYRPQLEAYRRAAAMLFGLDPSQVSARLIFTGPGVVVTL